MDNAFCQCVSPRFHEFKRQLEYKAKKFGCEIIVADCWFPSSKTCSSCGHTQDMPLKERTYNCGSCGHSMDRDLNAAINLSRLAFIVKAY
ncbi:MULTISPECIES: zinc ribbon domain-containing protein [unclassified Microcoleus]|uniref:zinc ribbon domain-containing protein n=1 Tax=unclassified Microcoleus TaxID=2642155 RepID=UPI0025D45F0E|nr:MULTISPECIES: zinc ribbon domain-containing protein [unclassified Microcoleus]